VTPLIVYNDSIPEDKKKGMKDKDRATVDSFMRDERRDRERIEERRKRFDDPKDARRDKWRSQVAPSPTPASDFSLDNLRIQVRESTALAHNSVSLTLINNDRVHRHHLRRNICA
jgi:hypothetical protein